MSAFDRIYQNLLDRRERVITGKYNCLPFPFPRFKNYLPGWEQGCYIIITANQKIGKSKLADKLFVYEPLFFCMEHPEMKVKVFYFTLEMTAEEKYLEFQSYLLFKLDGITISPSDLKSTDNSKPVPLNILEKLASDRYRRYTDKFEEVTTYIDDIKNPTGIYKYCRDHAANHGHFNYSGTFQKTDPVSGRITTENQYDPINPYEQDDPEEYRLVIVDNASNLTLESGMNKMQTIDKLSKYGITIAKQLKYIFVLVQHQAQQQEGIENFKLDRVKPTTDGLADCKTTSRDAHMVIGLYSPFKFEKETYDGYNIKRLKGYCRFMEVLEDRHYGSAGNICPLFFNGASSDFEELPRADDTEGLNQVYSLIDSIERQRVTGPSTLLLLFSKIKNFINKESNGKDTRPRKKWFRKNHRLLW